MHLTWIQNFQFWLLHWLCHGGLAIFIILPVGWMRGKRRVTQLNYPIDLPDCRCIE